MQILCYVTYVPIAPILIIHVWLYVSYVLLFSDYNI